MMRQVLILLLTTAWVLGQGHATDAPEGGFEEATKKLEGGDPKGAIEVYEKIIKDGWHAPELYHNLAVAHDRLNEPNQALAQAYRALLLSPRSPEFRADFSALAKKVDLPSPRQKVLQRRVRAMQWFKPAAITAAILFWVGLLCLVGRRDHPLCSTVGILSLAFAFSAAISAGVLHHKLPAADTAWMIATSATPLLASHSDGAPEIGSLPPLEEIRIQAVRGEWAHVLTLRDRTGWVRMDKIAPLFPWQS